VVVAAAIVPGVAVVLLVVEVLQQLYIVLCHHAYVGASQVRIWDY
jgi:hypothetical protein